MLKIKQLPGRDILIEPGDHIVIDNTKGDQFNRANVVYGKGSEKLQCLRKRRCSKRIHIIFISIYGIPKM